MDLPAAKQVVQQIINDLSLPDGTRLGVDVDANPDRLNIIAISGRRAGVVVITKEALEDHGHKAINAAIERLRRAIYDKDLPLLTGAPVQLGMLDSRGWTDGSVSPYSNDS
ncbi:hypothetical protein DEDE109153_15665 [Deinococcus deserti]|uniref:Uncharacterized protein n=1 Tax=Deinococcus deserti (strain DSM 17065 / CIP 109153 / LMG 22923 / VCD115) TaxID=546414 RepID=C1D2J5_DEIDV|nr:hypothetical protein [Deinococcus deserti]ACO47634.2 Hypothetical protein Deide_1p01752 [Deinococcus deserti VCD115]